MTYTKKMLFIPALCSIAFQVLAASTPPPAAKPPINIGYRCEVQEQFNYGQDKTTVSGPPLQTKIAPCPAQAFGGQAGLVFTPSSATKFQSPLPITAGNTFCPRDLFPYVMYGASYNTYGTRVINIYGAVSYITGFGGSVTYEVSAPGLTIAPVTLTTHAQFMIPKEQLIASILIPNESTTGPGCNTNFAAQISFKTTLR